jgi:hypothetical protein
VAKTIVPARTKTRHINTFFFIKNLLEISKGTDKNLLSLTPLPFNIETNQLYRHILNYASEKNARVSNSQFTTDHTDRHGKQPRTITDRKERVKSRVEGGVVADFSPQGPIVSPAVQSSRPPLTLHPDIIPPYIA